MGITMKRRKTKINSSKIQKKRLKNESLFLFLVFQLIGDILVYTISTFCFKFINYSLPAFFFENNIVLNYFIYKKVDRLVVFIL